MKPTKIDCKGCGIAKYVICSFNRYSLEHECPCIDCLVKVMCNKTCDYRQEVRINVFLEYKKGMNK